ncbi:MAG: heme o synthase [Planctomycetota bacterium]
MSQATGGLRGGAPPIGSWTTRTGWARRLHELSALTKPRIALMVLITTSIGFAMGMGLRTEGAGFPWVPLLAALAGAGLSCMGAAALNQWWERDTDGMMQRTRDRPLPAGRVAPGEALAVGLALSATGVGALSAVGLWLAAGLTAATVFAYVAVYTPLKRVTPLALWIGAVPGAAPPLIGFAAAAETLNPLAWCVFALMFIWQAPHFLAIAWLYRDDYARAGLKMLPVVEPDGRRTFGQILLTSIALLPLGMAPTWLGYAGWLSFIVCTLAGSWLLVEAIRLVFVPSRPQAKRLFLTTLAYLPIVLAIVSIDRL